MKERLTRLREWWGSPVVLNRLVLFLHYLVAALIGMWAWIATNPTLDAAVGDVYTAWWGVAMTFTGVACAATVTSEKLEAYEHAASIVLSALLISFIVAVAELMHTGARDRAEYMTMAVYVSLLPVWRATWLISRSGSRRE